MIFYIASYGENASIPGNVTDECLALYQNQVG